MRVLVADGLRDLIKQMYETFVSHQSFSVLNPPNCPLVENKGMVSLSS